MEFEMNQTYLQSLLAEIEAEIPLMKWKNTTPPGSVMKQVTGKGPKWTVLLMTLDNRWAGTATSMNVVSRLPDGLAEKAAKAAGTL